MGVDIVFIIAEKKDCPLGQTGQTRARTVLFRHRVGDGARVNA